MSDNHREIAMHAGTQFALIVENYLSDVIAAAQTTEKPISFGCTATFRPHPKSGLIHMSLRAKPPKIPRPGMDPVDFTLQLDTSEQLEMLFAGKPQALLAEVAKQEATAEDSEPEPGSDYEPGDNAEVPET